MNQTEQGTGDSFAALFFRKESTTCKNVLFQAAVCRVAAGNHCLYGRCDLSAASKPACSANRTG